VRLDCIRALGKIGREAKDAVPELIKTLSALGFSDKMSTLEIVKTLGEIGPDAKKASPILVGLFAFNDEKLFNTSVEPVGKIGYEGTIKVLTAALKDPNDNIRIGAAKALVKTRPTKEEARAASNYLKGRANAELNPVVRDAMNQAWKELGGGK